jgi:cytochrome P450
MHAARIEGFVHDLIAERRAEGRDHGDVLSLLLFAQDEEGERFSDRALRDQTLTFLAAGHETTANALGWTFALLSAHRAVRERLLEELHPKLADRIPLVQDLPALRYLYAVVRESLRLYPPAWIISRTVMQAVHLGDYDFPVGSVVLVSPWLMHRDPRFWEAPLAFRPERWLDSPEPPAASGMYFPFGAGARMCIGMPFAQLELRLVLAMILRRFFPEVEAGWDDRPIARVTLRPRQGLPVLIRSVSTQIRETGGMTTVSL